MGSGHDDAQHVISYATNTLIWCLLLILTAVTVYVAGLDFGFLNVVVALAVATTKAGLVVLYFMHLRYEGWLLRSLVFMAFFILAIAIGFTFFDLAYR